MKTVQTPSPKKLKNALSAANIFQANRTSASPSREKADKLDNHPARLSSEERHLLVELAPHWRAERQSFSHDADEQEWLEAEIGIELDRMRRRDLQQSD
jgi:hypothetical protein